MSIYIQKMTNDVTLLDGDMPLSPKQLEQLVSIILGRLAQEKEEKDKQKEIVQILPNSRPK